MTPLRNQYDQPIGPAIPEWSERPLPSAITLEGQYCRLEPLRVADHADDLFDAYQQAPDDRDWTYLSIGPWHNVEEYRAFVTAAKKSQDPRHYAVIDRRSDKAVGTLALMRQQPQQGSVEVGYVTFSPRLKRSSLSSEAQFLLMEYVFDTLGYRRYEWKCDNLNQPCAAPPSG